MNRLNKLTDPEALVREAVEVIDGGGVVILPADTVYGLMGSMDHRDAVERVYRIKQRPRHKPFGVFTNTERLDEVGVPNAAARQIAEAFWPGPASLIVEKSRRVPAWFSEEASLLVLSARNRILADIVARAKSPIFSSTCNVAGEAEAIQIDQLEPFVDHVDFVGAVEGMDFTRKTSTIINCLMDPPSVIRRGAVPIETVQRVVPDLQVDTGALIQ